MRPAHRALTVLALSGILVGAFARPASADESDERALAERYSPVVRLVNQTEPCGPGEPYAPADVNALFDNPTVALRGPWSQRDLVKVGPSAEDLSAGLPGYSLDFPGDPLRPGCEYEEWADQTFAGTQPTVYAHVATEATYPGRLALQYWFYYPFNDFNNKHEGDWERIQLEFDASDAAAALQTEPVRAVYSAHNGSEYAEWGDDKLELVNDTHPTVYVAAGSHASKFSEGLFLLRSGSQGLGCDSTIGPTHAVTSVARTIPSDQTRAVEEYPWIAFEGRWGQRLDVEIYDGPGGPATKDQWTEPFTWSSTSAAQSYAVPGGSLYGVTATDFFCNVVARGSSVVIKMATAPWLTLGVLALLLGIGLRIVRATSWGTSQPYPLAGRREIGEMLGVAWRVYRKRWRTFAVISLPLAAVSIVFGVLEQVLNNADSGGEIGTTSLLADLVSGAGLLSLLFLVPFTGLASVHVLLAAEDDRPISATSGMAAAAGQTWLLVRTLTLILVITAILGLTFVLVPIALLLVAGWSLFVPVLAVEGLGGARALRRAWRVARPQIAPLVWMLILLLLAIGIVGGLLGTLVLLLVQAPFTLVNLIPGITSALLGPYVGLVAAYLYFNGRARLEEPERAAENTPA